VETVQAPEITHRLTLSFHLSFSTEHDLVGNENVPISAYYGIQTQRAMKNFDITGVPISHFPELIRALSMVKKAAALANFDLGQLSKEKMNAIVAACDELIEGETLYDRTLSIANGFM
jgi:aspartate ammonia-lyase